MAEAVAAASAWIASTGIEVFGIDIAMATLLEVTALTAYAGGAVYRRRLDDHSQLLGAAAAHPDRGRLGAGQES